MSITKKSMLGLIGLIFIICTISTVAFAANGDIVGNIYSTNIIAYVNGKPITSYNIGGRTAIVVEDLDNYEGGLNYGFYYSYDDTDRALTAYSTVLKGYGDTTVKRGKVGEIVGHIYETDITVTMNGVPVTGYNIDGKTAVVIEDLGTVTEDSPNADYGYSKYLCNFKWDEENREVWLNSFNAVDVSSNAVPKLQYTFNDNVLDVTFDQFNDYYDTTTRFNFSEAFGKDINHIKPLIMNGETIGSMYVSDRGDVYTDIDMDLLYEKTKNMSVVLSYDQAKKFIEKSYNILDKRDTDSATIYLTEKDGVKYLFYAMKKGGLSYEGSYDYDTVELRDSEDGVMLYLYPFAGTHGTTSATLILEPNIYDFSKTYRFLLGRMLDYNIMRDAEQGLATVTVNGANHSVPALYINGVLLVDADETAKICGLNYNFENGRFIFDTDGISKDIQITFDHNNITRPQNVGNFQRKRIVVNGNDFDNSVQAYLYNDNSACIAADFYTKLIGK